jgi:hypothetical protein
MLENERNNLEYQLIPVVSSWVDLDRLGGRGRPWLSFLFYKSFDEFFGYVSVWVENHINIVRVAEKK